MGLLGEVYHPLKLFAAVAHDVTLDQSVHVTRDDACKNVDDRQPVAQELIEDLIVVIRAERLLVFASVVGVEVLPLANTFSCPIRRKTALLQLQHGYKAIPQDVYANEIKATPFDFKSPRELFPSC